MTRHKVSVCLLCSVLCGLLQAFADPVLLDNNLQLRLVLNTTNSSGAPSIRIAKDPSNNQLYYLKYNGDIFQLNVASGSASTSVRVYSAADHGISNSALGMAIGPDGTIYVIGDISTNSGNSTFATIPNGDLFGTDNGPDRDMSDELNWLQAGLHYGFPWRMGGAANPQQFANYDPSTDLLLEGRFVAVHDGTYHNDPTFPPPPANFFEPVINLGPDADSYRDPADGSIKDASNLGQTLGTFTAHRSPLGLVFDTAATVSISVYPCPSVV